MKRLLLLVSLLLLTGGPAWSAPATDTTSRIQWIQNRLNAAAGPARLWQYGWCGLHGVMAVYYGVKAHNADAPDEKHDRVDAEVSGTSSLLGFGTMLLSPLTTATDAQTLANTPATTPAQQAAKLKQAEALLRQDAEQEQNQRSFQAHVVTVLVALVSGAIVASDGHRTDDGAVLFAESLMVGEVQIYTAPTDATRAWQAYQQGELNASTAQMHHDGGLVMSALPHGVALNYWF